MRIGIDLGGTKIEGLALADDGTEVVRRRVATPAGDYDGTITAIVDLVYSLETDVGEAGTVGIGTPGALSPTSGLLRNSNSVALNDHPVDKDLERRLDREIRIANDANCFALSEAVDGGGARAASVFGVIIGTGVGGGVVINGAVVDGPNAIAGEWGHNPMPGGTDGRDCYCGRIDCVERYLSGPGFAAEFGDGQTAEEIAAASPAAVERYAERLARALAVVINILDPEVVVLGGGMSNIESLYETVPDRWGEWIFSDAVSTRLARNVHGDSSGVRGAAWLW